MFHVEHCMFVYPKTYDVAVVGAGHAGIEAAMAAARLGCETVMLTQNLDSVGQMSCNPAIGGQAKGQMVREIDALGGVMGSNTDATAIQFRMLNCSKGPSVRSPRAQCDKKAYQFRAKAVLERQEGLDLMQGNVIGILSQVGGRMGDSASSLSDSLRELGFEVRRFKTGTPCRLNGRTIDFTKCAFQMGDEHPVPFSFVPERVGDDGRESFTLNRWKGGEFHVEQLPCWTTRTTSATHDFIRANLDKSPLYTGRFEGVGPRYCPSIEDKIVRFAEK